MFLFTMRSTLHNTAKQFILLIVMMSFHEFWILGRGAYDWFSGCDIPALPNLFCTSFLKYCGRGKGLGTTTYPKIVVLVDKSMLPVRYFHSNKASVWVSNGMLTEEIFLLHVILLYQSNFI